MNACPTGQVLIVYMFTITTAFIGLTGAGIALVVLVAILTGVLEGQRSSTLDPAAVSKCVSELKKIEE